MEKANGAASVQVQRILNPGSAILEACLKTSVSVLVSRHLARLNSTQGRPLQTRQRMQFPEARCKSQRKSEWF